MPKQFTFDERYYRRFYIDPATRVASPESTRRLGRFVCGYLKYLGEPIENVLDIGCGMGYWRRVIAEQFPGAMYLGVEWSEYLCDRFGWEQGSIVDYAAPEPFDLVVCQGVLQYLVDADCERAIENLGRLCRGALFLEALTQEDWQHNCDRSTTDGSTYLRPARWYRERLRPLFTNCGGGVFLARQAKSILFELEKLDES